jgi:hypothetical protein
MRKTISESEQRKLDIASQSSAAEGIRQALKDLKERKIRSSEEVFAEFEALHKIPK